MFRLVLLKTTKTKFVFNFCVIFVPHHLSKTPVVVDELLANTFSGNLE